MGLASDEMGDAPFGPPWRRASPWAWQGPFLRWGQGQPAGRPRWGRVARAQPTGHSHTAGHARAAPVTGCVGLRRGRARAVAQPIRTCKCVPATGRTVWWQRGGASAPVPPAGCHARHKRLESPCTRAPPPSRHHTPRARTSRARAFLTRSALTTPAFSPFPSKPSSSSLSARAAFQARAPPMPPPPPKSYPSSSPEPSLCSSFSSLSSSSRMRFMLAAAASDAARGWRFGESMWVRPGG